MPLLVLAITMTWEAITAHRFNNDVNSWHSYRVQQKTLRISVIAFYRRNLGSIVRCNEWKEFTIPITENYICLYTVYSLQV